jgi:uncharacterized protein (TIGR00255 family)
MTGFGSAPCEDSRFRAAVTVKSVNHRFLELSFHLPRWLGDLEGDLRGLVQGRLRRGKVEFAVRFPEGAPEGLTEVRISPERARGVARALFALKQELGLQGDVTLADVARVPGVLESVEAQLPEGAREEVLQAASRALESLEEMRRAEGRNLETELRAALAEVTSRTNHIASQVEEGKAARKEALVARAQELIQELGLDGGRLYQEIARSVERHDVSEEIDRLRSHVGQTESLLGGEGEVGKRLDFFSQELMREANTVGSKAISAGVVQDVIGLKNAIERFREQVQNVE